MADNFSVFYPTEYSKLEFIKDIHKSAMSTPGLNRAISIRIGRYLINDLSVSASAMYDRASIAERSIKNRYDTYVATYDEAMRAEILYRQEIVNEMDEALKTNQFEMWLQPQYNHSSGSLIGAEALIRWRHPQKGILPPGKFIPIFEQSGFIYETDKFVWEQACRTIRRWMDSGNTVLPIAVNVSRYDIFRVDFVKYIVGLTEKYNIPAELLHIEITESAFAESAEQIVGVVKKLVGYGFTVEIDDFGSGYSSLNTLKCVPAQVVKLDMRFLDDTDSQRGGNIISSVVRMAKWLGMAIIAEGVEEVEQADFLKSIGCEYVQGYLYAKPMLVEEYEKLFDTKGKEQHLLTMETVKNLDNNAFWNPKSMDTLIFNSFVGSACIYEYSDDKIELLRATDKYVQMIGKLGMSLDDALKLDWFAHLSESDRTAFKNLLNSSLATKEEVSGEYTFDGLTPDAPKIYVRLTMRIIAAVGSRYLIYSINQNLTEQRIAEKKANEAAERLKTIMKNVNGGITASTLKNGKLELVFSNDRYYEMLGFSREQYEAEVPDIFALIHQDDRERVKALFKDTYINESSGLTEYRVIKRDGSAGWVKVSISATHFSGISDTVQLRVFTDITAEKTSSMELDYSDSQLRFLNETAHEMIAESDIEKGVDEMLRKLLDYFDSDRAYVFEFDDKAEVANNTYEVCKKDVKKEIDNLHNIPISIMGHWIHAFDNQSFVSIDEVAKLDESHVEKELLQSQGITSLIAVPLYRNGVLTGFLGIDNPRKHCDRVDRLAAIGDYIVVLLLRRSLDASITTSNKMLQSIMNDMPGGFVRMKYTPGKNAVPLYFNEGFQKLVAMNNERLFEIYSENAMAGVHPDDYGIVEQAINKMLSDGIAHSAKYRLLHGDGGYIWVMIFGRAIKETGGDIYFNIYYIKPTEA